MDTGQHELRGVQAMCPCAPAAATTCTEAADEPILGANLQFHALLTRFKALTDCPVLVNTSFNVRGEPIVCTPEDAFRCFMGNELDLLAVGNCVLRKEHQPAELRQDYAATLAPD